MVRMQVVTMGTDPEAGRTKLHLACGNNPIYGWINVDIEDKPGVDRIVDLNKRWCWAESTIDEIYINCSLEHLDNVYSFMSEAYRVLKNGGILRVIVPHYNAGIANHVDHRHFFNFDWFKFFLVEEDRKGIYAFDTPSERSYFKLIKSKITYSWLIRWIPIEKVKRKLAMMIGDIASTIDTIFEVKK